MRVTVLGCGGSEGVPVVGGNWGACDPANPKNRRSRASVMVETGGAALLIDTSPDLRQQLLDNNFSRVDAVLWTHAHADHCHGIADLREVCRLRGAPIDAFAAPEHLTELQNRFGFCFEPLPENSGVYRTVLTPHVICGPFLAAGVPVTPFYQDHGYGRTLGFRIGGFAYSTDVVRLDDAAFAALEGVELWIVDCLRDGKPHATHAHLPLTLSWIERVKPKRAVLTHMNILSDYAALRDKLPPGVEPGFDSMVIELNGR